ncbi:leucine-rich repeat protein [Flavobacterium psychrophilum]|uniref:leucine-rich repeat domain-containing protein n=1 Tax=Flavobacterium psychrophilum TaxID=96345 RepID=UPI00054C1F86|nr:leucine-rich repeat protein [Flavobacterium psychrophilum]EKT3958019.1 leucine-rich repeat protein [Flavobacterium psychrophilum]EKT3964333.1 leucine-rich repeat protein [Flavobacterium psychrophilum]EKT4517794.1 leucine-rich repeat protein [Flavobacterium psychrophilum]
MRKLLFIILIPFLGIAQDFTENGINYTITSSTAPFTASVASNTRFSGDAVIPETVVYNSENYAVTAIADEAFKGNYNLTSVSIGDAVTSVGESAFNNCVALTSVTIGNSVISIGNSAFIGSSLTSLTIGNSVASIGSLAFFGCFGLTSLTIPSSVTSIANQAFSMCSGLTSVTIPNFVTSIGDGAFSMCSGLISVTIPNAVTSIGDYTFMNCTSLTTVNSYATIPLVINENAFHNLDKSICALNVPAGTEAAYQAAAVWKDFSPISGSLLSNHSFAIESNLKIYPNPVSEILNIALQENLQLQKVNFYNTLGQLIKTTNHSEINISSFAKGIYFVEVMTNQGKATKTIIVQ